MNASPDDPQDAFVFDEDFVAAAKFREPTAKARQGTWFTRWRAERRRRRMAARFGDTARPRPRLRKPGKIGARGLTLLIVAGLVLIAVILNYLDPLGLHPAPAPKVVHVTLEPVPPQSNAP